MICLATTFWVKLHAKKKQLLWIVTEFAKKCDKCALTVLWINVALAIVFIGYFCILAFCIEQESLSLSFSNCLFRFSLKIFLHTLLFFTTFVLFIVCTEALVYKMPRILIWLSLILPQTIIWTTNIQFPSDDEIQLTQPQDKSITDAVTNLNRYVHHFHHLICLHHHDPHNTSMILRSINRILFDNAKLHC
eukprot:381402_1